MDTKHVSNVPTNVFLDAVNIIKDFDTLSNITAPPEQFQVLKKDMFIRPKLAKPDGSIDRKNEIDAANEKESKGKDLKKDELSRVFDKVQSSLTAIENDFRTFEQLYDAMKGEEETNEIIKTFFATADTDDDLKFSYDGKGFDKDVLKKKREFEKMMKEKADGITIDEGPNALSGEGGSRKLEYAIQDQSEEDSGYNLYDVYKDNESDDEAVPITVENTNSPRFSSNVSDIDKEDEGQGMYVKLFARVKKFIQIFSN